MDTPLNGLDFDAVMDDLFKTALYTGLVWILSTLLYVAMIIGFSQWIIIWNNLSPDLVEYAPQVINQNSSLPFILVAYFGGIVMSYIIAHRILYTVLKVDNITIRWASVIWCGIVIFYRLVSLGWI